MLEFVSVGNITPSKLHSKLKSVDDNCVSKTGGTGTTSDPLVVVHKMYNSSKSNSGTGLTIKGDWLYFETDIW